MGFLSAGSSSLEGQSRLSTYTVLLRDLGQDFTSRSASTLRSMMEQTTLISLNLPLALSLKIHLAKSVAAESSSQVIRTL